MTGYRPGIYWQYTWRYIGPVIMSVILVASIIKMCLVNPEYSAWIAEEVLLIAAHKRTFLVLIMIL